MTIDDVRAEVVKEIERNVAIIQKAKSEKYDKWAKEKVKVLVDVLDRLDECKTLEEVGQHLQLMLRGAQGAVDGINDLLQIIGQKA